MTEPVAPAVPEKQRASWLRLPPSMRGSGMIGLLIVVFWAIIAVFGPALAPYDPGAIVAPDVFDPASLRHPFGSDYLGRDVLSRLLTGARFTVGLSFVAALLASVTGITLALFAAVSSRWVDESLSRLMDALISIPSKIFALVMVAAFGSSVFFLLLIIAVTFVPGAYRIARSMAVNLNQMEYVQVARARGEGRRYIAGVEILPNMIRPMLADFGVRFVLAVLLLSGLSFLGLGMQPPDADLGSLVRENMSGLSEEALAIIVPAVSIAVLTVGVNLLIDSIPGRARSGTQDR